MTEHTPAPWTVEIQESDACESGYITGHITSPLHTYCGNTRGRRDSIADPASMTWADAHLIAAAPDLLAALEDLAKFIQVAEVRFGSMEQQGACERLLDHARVAVEKAKSN